MTIADFLVEAIDAAIRFENRSFSELASELGQLGFRRDDDLLFVPRPDGGPIWESVDLVQVEAWLEEERTDEDSDHCDRIAIEYLLATLPAECGDEFIEICAKTLAKLDGTLWIDGAESTIDDLRTLVDDGIAKMRSLKCEPGSKDVAILLRQRRAQAVN